MKRLFLEKYFPASRAANIHKEICGVKQHNGESLHESWEHFKKLCASCPHHQIREQLLIQYFYEGLLPTDRSMIDAASGGALVDKTPETVRNLIANMAANSQQFGTRLDLPSKNVNEWGIQPICAQTLQEEPTEQVNAVGGFPGQPQRKYDPYSNTYNMGCRDHPNLSYENPKVNQPMTQNHPSYQQYRQPYPPRQQPSQTSNSSMSLEDIVKSLPTNNLQFQQETWANIQSLDNQMGEMATTISWLEAQSSGKLPSQTVANPRENASAIILRSGKEVEIPVKAAPASSKQEKEKNVTKDKNIPNDDDIPKCKCEVNNPFFYAIKQVPRYAKSVKELCTIKIKWKLKGCEKVRVGEKVYAIIQRKLLAKCIDLGVVEDVLAQVNDLIFPADFYVLDMENGDQTAPIFLGRTFLKTSKTKIDVHSGTLTIEFDGEIVKFNIYDAMKYPGDNNHVYSIDVIDPSAQEICELDRKDELEVAISKYLEKKNEELALSSDLQETVATLNDIPRLQQLGNVLYIALPISNERPLHSVLQAPTPNLKPLPSHLKYMFLGDGGTLPVIIFSKLSAPQEEKFVQDELHL
ncbi:uncharacterized protein [Aristolochia californica]|uniref:uncharacterized protein n=1 Tax=Aristolochia californica TaxID=171875 RepID=UPI0035DE6423